jgi:ABC-type multidrug transport system fused ATPase/permease subunit
MINEARQARAWSSPHMTMIPCIAISSLVLGFNLLADGLREDLAARLSLHGTKGIAGTSRPIGPVLGVQGLCISYYTRAGEIPAVVDFNLRTQPGETVGLVGESGCGKSTVAMAIMQYLGQQRRASSAARSSTRAATWRP